MSQRLSYGDDTDAILIIPLQIHDNNNGILHKTDTDPSILSIVLTIIQICEQRVTEHLNSIHEIDTVSTYILTVFLLIPFELHSTIVYTICLYVKRWFQKCSRIGNGDCPALPGEGIKGQ